MINDKYQKKLHWCWGFALCCKVLSAFVNASLHTCIQPFPAHIWRCANTTEEKKTSILEVEKRTSSRKTVRIPFA
jgi:hypothetical protein